MVLIPVTCPVCGAAVELREGQTLVHCTFCKTSSYLNKPVTAPTPQRAPIPTQPRPHIPVVVSAQPKRKGKGWIVLVVLGALVAAGLAGVGYVGGAGVDYYADARPAAELLRAEYGKNARYKSLLMHPSYMHVRVMRDGKLHAVRIYGRRPERLEPEGTQDPKELERTLFDLSKVDFGVVSKIVRHAKKRVPGGEFSHVMLELPYPRRTRLFWEATLKSGGDHRMFLYDLDGKPLVDQPLRLFTATPHDLGERFRKHIGFEPRVISFYLDTNHARVTVIAEKSDKDTDVYTLWEDGAMSAPSPDTSDGNAEELAAKAFRLDEVTWKRVPGVVADASKRLGAEIKGLTVERRKGKLEMYLYGNSDRGASRTAYYDIEGRFVE